MSNEESSSTAKGTRTSKPSNGNKNFLVKGYKKAKKFIMKRPLKGFQVTKNKKGQPGVIRPEELDESTDFGPNQVRLKTKT